MEYPEIRTATDFVRLVENVLGWSPDHRGGPEWKTYAVEAGKVNRKRKSNPRLYSWENCLLALEYLRRKQITPRSPAGVLWSVEQALVDAAVDVPATEREVGDLVAQALQHEMAERNPGWDTWVTRLTRAQGPARLEVYNHWKDARSRV